MSIALNSAIVFGNDQIKLMARLHGSCEIHTWIRSKNKKWVAGIIKDGLKKGLFRKNMGWEKVVRLLNKDNNEDVVTSYSVCDDFPNGTIAGINSKDFYELLEKKQWLLAIKGLKKSGGGLEIKPNNWDRFFFTNGKNMLDVVNYIRTATSEAKDTFCKCGKPKAEESEFCKECI